MIYKTLFQHLKQLIGRLQTRVRPNIKQMNTKSVLALFSAIARLDFHRAELVTTLHNEAKKRIKYIATKNYGLILTALERANVSTQSNYGIFYLKHLLSQRLIDELSGFDSLTILSFIVRNDITTNDALLSKDDLFHLKDRLYARVGTNFKVIQTGLQSDVNYKIHPKFEESLGNLMAVLCKDQNYQSGFVHLLLFFYKHGTIRNWFKKLLLSVYVVRGCQAEAEILHMDQIKTVLDSLLQELSSSSPKVEYHLASYS